VCLFISSDGQEEEKALQLIEATSKRAKNMLRLAQHSHVVRRTSLSLETATLSSIVLNGAAYSPRMLNPSLGARIPGASAKAGG
jgi:hypothetical protein